MRKIAITDIHGCKTTFLALLDSLAFAQSDELYLLGDYVDRGPDSKGVIDTIFDLKKNGYTVRCLRGNHEELVLQAADNDFTGLERWLVGDGKKTMESFNVTQCSDIPREYLDFMRELPYFIETDGYILVHGGLDFSIPDPLSNTREMCWLRNWDWYHQVRYDWLGERTILHGHTPMATHHIEDQFYMLEIGRCLDIDAGCVFAERRFTDRDGMGSLCAFDMSNRELKFQEYVE